VVEETEAELNNLTDQDILNLVAYLESVGKQTTAQL